MPITFFNTPDGVRVRQSFDCPTVYLDHWAVRLFSDDQDLQDRLVSQLLDNGGTLLLSHFNLAEFAAPTDPRHCRDAEAFLDRLLPNIFLTDFRLDEIQRRELSEPNNLKRFWPTADLPQLKLLAEGAHSSLQRLTMHGFISLAHHHRDSINSLNDEVAESVVNRLEQVRAEPTYVEKVRRTVPDDSRTRTMVIMGELMRDLNLNRTAPFNNNDVNDFIHAVMPVNCCDFVLLDSAWVERVETMKRRLTKARANMPVAQCYSKKNGGIEAFLAGLAAFDRSQELSPPLP